VLFDLAYFKYRRFARIDENGGYFVSRLKQNANPVITAELRNGAGAPFPLEGKQLREVLDDLSRTYIDVGGRSRVQAWAVQRDAVARYEVVPRRRRPQRGRRRLPSVRDKSVEREFFPADLAQIYRCRWEVELLFRELKTQYDLDEFDTSNEDVVKILLYAALLSLLVSRELLELVTEQAGDEIVFAGAGGDLPVARPAHPPRTRRVSRLFPPPLLERLIEDAQKIHQQRPILQETLATATQPRCES